MNKKKFKFKFKPFELYWIVIILVSTFTSKKIKIYSNVNILTDIQKACQ